MLLDKSNQASAPSPAPAPVKAVGARKLDTAVVAHYTKTVQPLMAKRQFSVDEPTEDELKELLPQSEYAFLLMEGDNKLPFNMLKSWSVEEKSAHLQPGDIAPMGSLFSTSKNLTSKLLILKEPITSAPIICPRLENPYEKRNDPKKINERFPLENVKCGDLVRRRF
ncbi:hypothetical protein Tco_0657463 [Tanacetum coccineum]|uniref:Uncharacterized protein n=1 Tax=Tanacetum coccineum TaxID=301880 RepID=A0ABQ4XBM7_9ASTR